MWRIFWVFYVFCEHKAGGRGRKKLPWVEISMDRTFLSGHRIHIYIYILPSSSTLKYPSILRAAIRFSLSISNTCYYGDKDRWAVLFWPEWKEQRWQDVTEGSSQGWTIPFWCCPESLAFSLRGFKCHSAHVPLWLQQTALTSPPLQKHFWSFVYFHSSGGHLLLFASFSCFQSHRQTQVSVIRVTSTPADILKVYKANI